MRRGGGVGCWRNWNIPKNVVRYVLGLFEKSNHIIHIRIPQTVDEVRILRGIKICNLGFSDESTQLGEHIISTDGLAEQGIKHVTEVLFFFLWNKLAEDK
jgi:hypothetical protein